MAAPILIAKNKETLSYLILKSRAELAATAAKVEEEGFDWGGRLFAVYLAAC